MVKKIINNRIIFFFLLIPLIKPVYLDMNPSLVGSIFNILRILSAGVILILYFLNGKISLINGLIFLFHLLVLLITKANNGNVRDWLRIMVLTCALCMLTEMCIRENFYKFIRGIHSYLFVLVIINFICLIIFPTGMYRSSWGSNENWFLGNKNALATIIFPFITFSLINSYIKNNKITFFSYASIAICILSIMRVLSVGSMIGCFLFIIFIILFSQGKTFRFLNYKNYAMVGIGLSAFLIFSDLSSKLSNIFLILFNKSSTYLIRLFLWRNSITYLKKSIIFGFGNEYSIVTSSKFGNDLALANMHNGFLDIIYIGGISAFILFIIIIFLIHPKLMSNKGNRIVSIVAYSLFVFYILFANEAYREKPLFFVIIIIAFYSNQVVEQFKKKGC